MIELAHNPVTPQALLDFSAAYPQAGPNEFDGAAFHLVKKIVKASLHHDQGGLCAYCETPLEADTGQIDHIKPKRGNDGHPHLTFSYTNYAHGCIRADGCGQRKGDRLLPIEPAPGCNERFSLSSDGSLEAMPTLTRREKHVVRQTRDMLGLQNAALVLEREKWIKSFVSLLQEQPSLAKDFLKEAPFRYILLRLIS
jgi:uncharacterized protein (TIGR02646 family)